jgi:hypothetical protein
MLDLAERDGRWEKAQDKRYLVGYEAGTGSRYQRIWEGHEMSTLRFELVKSGTEGRGQSDARGRRVLTARPFSHAPGLRRRGCLRRVLPPCLVHLRPV